jgi:hypothetical protein
MSSSNNTTTKTIRFAGKDYHFTIKVLASGNMWNRVEISGEGLDKQIIEQDMWYTLHQFLMWYIETRVFKGRWLDKEKTDLLNSVSGPMYDAAKYAILATEQRKLAFKHLSWGGGYTLRSVASDRISITYDLTHQYIDQVLVDGEPIALTKDEVSFILRVAHLVEGYHKARKQRLEDLKNIRQARKFKGVYKAVRQLHNIIIQETNKCGI